MGMARSKLRRDRNKGTSTDRRMSQTIKHLKHSVSIKENRIKELENEMNDLKYLYDHYTFYRDYVENLCTLSTNALSALSEEIMDFSKKSKRSIQLLKTASDFASRNVSKVLSNYEEIIGNKNE